MGVVIPQVVSEDRAGGAQVIDGGLRFDSSKSHYLSRTPGSAGNRKTWTWSGWVKRSGGNEPGIFSSYAGSNPSTTLYFNVDNKLVFYDYNSVYRINLLTTQVFRDFSSWYHIVVAVNTTAATSTNRAKIYVNGVQITTFDTATYPALNWETNWNSVKEHNIGKHVNYQEGSITNTYFIDGQELDPSYFGYTDPLTNTWRPKKYTESLREAEGSGNNAWNQEYTNSCLGFYFNGNPPIWLGRLRRTGSTSYASAVTFGTSTGVTLTSGDTLMWAYDESAAKLWVGRNGTWYASGDPANGTNPTFAGFSTTALLFKTLYYEDSGVSNGSDLYLTRITSGSASYSTPSGFSYWDGMNLNWRYGGGSTSSTSRADYIPQRITGKVYFETTVHWTGSGAWADYRIAGLSDEGNANINSFYLPFDGSAPIGQDRSNNVGIAWTAVNFGGSNTIEKATGALPILNTDGGGKVARVGVRTDSNASSLVLALPLVGIKSDFSNAINSGTSNKAITANGNAAASSAQSNFYGGSFVFDGTSDYIDIAASSDFAFGTGDFTVECWIYTTNTTSDSFYRRIYLTDGPTGNAGGNFQIALEPSTGKVNLWDSVLNLLGTSNVCNGAWHHIAGCRSGTTLRLFVDGVLESSTTYSTSVSPNSGSPRPRIGSYDGTTGDFDGYIQDLRVYKGVAKYTQNFIPASTDPDILPDTPSGVAYSSNVALVPSTDGAVAFDGNGDYLSLTDTNNDLDLGGLQASVEFFVYVTDLSATRVILNKGGGASGSPWNTSDGLEWTFVYVSGGTFYFQYNNAGSTGSITSSLSLGVWTHVAAATDASNNIALFINGTRVGTATNAVTKPTSRTLIRIGQDWVSQTHSGHISNVHFIKGSGAYDPTATTITVPTAPITSVANTKLLCCKSNSSETAFDVSPGSITANGNAAASNFNPFTVNINTQRGQESGYATWNPLALLPTYGGTLSNGNLTNTASGDSRAAYGTIPIPSNGKYFFEVDVDGSFAYIGISPYHGQANGGYPFTWSGVTNSVVYYGNTGTKYINTSETSYGASYTGKNTIGVAINADNSTVTFYKNGVSQGIISQSVVGSVPFSSTAGGSHTFNLNCGQKPFKFPPPAGFQPLALANTPRPTIVRPDQYVGIVTYTGNGGTLSLTTGFKPDFVWIKGRTAAYNHRVHDSVRGVGTNKQLFTNSTEAEGTETLTNNFVSFDTNGFTLGPTSSTNGMNELGTNFVAWCWKAGGNSNTYNINDVGYATASAAGLTAGTITPTGASVNTKSGFSIITWTGTSASGTVPHGLGIKPSFIIGRRRNGVANWCVYHISTGASQGLNLQSTAAAFANTTRFDGVEPTSTVFSVGSSGDLNAGDALAYCWAEIPGFSKFGSYTGNGSTNGPMIVTGFRPRWILLKYVSGTFQSGTTYNWLLYDTARNTYNESLNTLFPNDATQENVNGALYGIDVLSNGFKLRQSYYAMNDSGANYIYAAFAETPSFNLYGGQSNAR